MRLKAAPTTGFGRDSLFKGERLRREAIKKFRERRADNIFLRKAMRQGCDRWNIQNEINRIDGMIDNMHLGPRHHYLHAAKAKLHGRLGEVNQEI